MKKITIIALILCTFQIAGQAQSWGFGFKVGLNTSGVMGPSEQNAAGEDLESFGTIGGFQVGGLIQLKINKYVGLQTEVLFSQKGADYKYEGESFKTFTNNIGAVIQTSGDRKSLVNATNGYINIPLMAYVNITRNLNFSLGGYMDILVTSSARGETFYSNGILANNSGEVDDFLVDYSFDYYDDEAGIAPATATSTTVLVGSENITIPSSEGAYYNYSSKDGNFYNPLDFGLVANLGWRFDNGLRFDLRTNYGLTDITNNFYDVSLSEKDANGQGIPRTDFDRSISYQLTIGFGF
ncbi:MAG: porin family protein [Saprospiraceae bacterium]